MIKSMNIAWGETGHAFVIAVQGASISESDVIGICKGKLAKYKWPRRVSFRTKFPRTSLGKVRKGGLD